MFVYSAKSLRLRLVLQDNGLAVRGAQIRLTPVGLAPIDLCSARKLRFIQRALQNAQKSLVVVVVSVRSTLGRTAVKLGPERPGPVIRINLSIGYEQLHHSDDLCVPLLGEDSFEVPKSMRCTV